MYMAIFTKSKYIVDVLGTYTYVAIYYNTCVALMGIFGILLARLDH